jgi:asparagine synthase (glutamine-hydrolysing)
MSKVHLHLRDHVGWQSSGGVHVRGHAFWKGEESEPVSLLEVFAQVQSSPDFLATLRRLNGFYAIVCSCGDAVYLAADHMRSCPLFYGLDGDKLYISDDAEWIRVQVRDEVRDPLAETEYSRAGFVTGADTLHPKVKQLQMGEALVFRTSGAGCDPDRGCHYQFRYGKPFEADDTELMRMHEAVLVRVFERLLRIANGRCLCVPLSGGFDSRLISLMLKRLGHGNLRAFSYGKPGNREARFSEQVARNLGITWSFVPYSNEAWYRWFRSGERKAFYGLADNLSSLPHLQDWPAVWELKKAGFLPDDTMFLPGHSGNCPTGEHIPPECLADREPSQELFVEVILGHHFGLQKRGSKKDDLGKHLRQRVLNQIRGYSFGSLEEVANACEQWEWQERQAKFVINSVRVYEFWGYEWWMPLWDAEFLDFWSRVPFGRRVRQGLYRMHVSELYAETAGISKRKAKRVTTDYTAPLRNWVKNSRLGSVARQIHDHRMKHSEYDSHPYAWYGIMPPRRFKQVHCGAGMFNSYLARERLGWITFDSATDDSV